MRIPALMMLFIAPALHAAESNADAPEFWGEQLPEGQVRTLDAALASFDPQAEATPTKFAGRIVDVCSKRGCWAMLEADGKSARVLPHGHDFMVPRDVRGDAIVYGTLASVDLREARAKFAAENPGEDNPVPAQEYRIDALGIELID